MTQPMIFAQSDTGPTVTITLVNKLTNVAYDLTGLSAASLKLFVQGSVVALATGVPTALSLVNGTLQFTPLVAFTNQTPGQYFAQLAMVVNGLIITVTDPIPVQIVAKVT